MSDHIYIMQRLLGDRLLSIVLMRNGSDSLVTKEEYRDVSSQ